MTTTDLGSVLPAGRWAAETAMALGVSPGTEWQRLKAEYLGVELTFCTNHSLAAAWATFFLGSHFEISTPPRGEVTCYFHFGTIDRAAIHEIIQSAPSVRMGIDRGRMATRWSLGAGQSLVVSDDADFWYVIDQDARCLVFLSDSEEPLALREVARQVRSIVMQLLSVEGWLQLHASAVVLGETGVVLPGNQGAGKSTTMLELLEAGGAVDFLSNDRVFCRAENGVLQMAGYPQTVRLGAGSLESSPRLKQHLHAWEHFHATLLPLSEQVAHPDKIDFTVKELCDILGCAYRVTTPAHVVAFPQLKLERSDPTLEPIDRAASSRLLAENTRFPDPAGDTWVGTLLFPKSDTSISTSCESVASHLRGMAVAGTAKEMAAQIRHYLAG